MATMQKAVWADAASRVSGFLAGCRDYPQSGDLAADLEALRTYGVARHPAWRSRIVSAEEMLSLARAFEAAVEAERAQQAATFAAAYRFQPRLERGKGIGAQAPGFGRSDPAKRARREINRAGRAEENRAMAKGFGCGKRSGSRTGKRRAA